MPDADPTIDTYPLPYGRYQEVLAEVSDPNVRKLVLHIEAEMKGLKELVYVARRVYRLALWIVPFALPVAGFIVRGLVSP